MERMSTWCATGRSTAAVAEIQTARYDPLYISGRTDHARPRRSRCAGAHSSAARRAGRRPRGVVGQGGYYPEEDEAVAEIVAAFEQGTGEQVEIATLSTSMIFRAKSRRRSRPGATRLRLRPLVSQYIAYWAFEDQLIDLSGLPSATFSDLFDSEVLDRVSLLNGRTGQKAVYGLPIGRTTNHIHVWKSLLERAGFTLADVPREWEAFWSFWCDQVQPAVREATGRDDIWGVGLPMSLDAATPGSSSCNSSPPTTPNT